MSRPFALIDAAFGGNIDDCRLLLANKADVNVRDDSDNTATMRAAQGGHVEIVKLLADKKADITAQNKAKATALVIAAEQGFPQIQAFLVACNADVEGSKLNADEQELSQPQLAAVGPFGSVMSRPLSSISFLEVDEKRMKTLVRVDFELTGDHVSWMDLMCQKYGVRNPNQVIRFLIQYSLEDGDRNLIFKTVRCRKCGIRFPKKSYTLEIYMYQMYFLMEMQAQFAIPSLDKALRVQLDFVQEGHQSRNMNDHERALVLVALERDLFTKTRSGFQLSSCPWLKKYDATEK